ncbi:LAQU0S08e04434g1_1 [Lachancea quebecensis]|uniref:LAQU0S08e04434g1_1 n=1 Tax=Lachancea quebecensis TaxID=1654605 RepID=A0A0P1KVF0_9SACH|nr:LAQU0S08e04434g1_1 [Lachancea quebecensis]
MSFAMFNTRDQTGCRRVVFEVRETEGQGLQFPIGRASLKDPERRDRENNFMFCEKSLSKKHAILCIKRLIPSDSDPFVPLLSQFRISIQDLGSTHGLVDLQSQDADASVIDLRNGERFGLIKLCQPVAPGQSRGAKLKFQVFIKTNESDDTNETLELLLRNVTHEGSPFVSRPGTVGEEELEIPLSPSSCSTSSSSSDLNYSEDIDLDLGEYGSNESTEQGSQDEQAELSKIAEDRVETDSSHHTLFVSDEPACLADDAPMAYVKIPAPYEPLFAPHSEHGDVSSRDEAELFDDKNTLEGTPECFDCSKSVNPYNEDELSDSVCGSAEEFNGFISRKRSYGPEDEGICSDKYKKAKTDTQLGTGTEISGFKKQVIIGSMVGFVAGSLGTLGLLVGIANMG